MFAGVCVIGCAVIAGRRTASPKVGGMSSSQGDFDLGLDFEDEEEMGM